MKVTLEALLPRLGVYEFQVIAFQGVSDLERSLVRRIRGWRDPRARFLVIRDNDNGDCRARKERLNSLIEKAGGCRPVKIRIVMQELEAWFLGDPEALEAAGLLKPGKRPRSLEEPEMKRRPVDVLRTLDRSYQKGIGARRIAPHLDPERSQATSMTNTISAIRELAASTGV